MAAAHISLGSFLACDEQESPLEVEPQLLEVEPQLLEVQHQQHSNPPCPEVRARPCGAAGHTLEALARPREAAAALVEALARPREAAAYVVEVLGPALASSSALYLPTGAKCVLSECDRHHLTALRAHAGR